MIDFKIVQQAHQSYFVPIGMCAVLTICGVLFLFVPTLSDASEETSNTFPIITNAVLIMLTGLVVTSLIFEGIQHHLQHNLPKVYLPVLNALNTELMGLGFLAVIFYFVVYYKALISLSKKVICPADDKFLDKDGNVVAEYHCDEMLLHYFEDIHMALLLLLVLFFLRVAFLLKQVTQMGQRWQEYEIMLKDPACGSDGITRQYHDRMANPVGFFDGVRGRACEALQFMLLRKRFVEAGKAGAGDQGAGDLDSNFSFSDYLSLYASHVTTEIVEIPPKEWLALEVFFCIIWAILQAPHYLRVRALFAMILFMLAFSAQLLGKIDWVFEQLILPYPKYDGSSKVTAGDGEPETRILKPPYVTNKMKGKGRKNPQECLFWLHEPEFFLHCLRFVMLASLIYFVLLIWAIPLAWRASNDGVYEQMLLVVLPIPLIFYIVFELPVRLLKKYTLCTCVEIMKDPKLIDRVLRMVTLRKSLRAIRLMHTLQAESYEQNGAVSDGDAVETKAEQKEKHGLREVFELFDTSGDGNIDTEELVGLMKALGVTLGEEEKQRVMRQCDKSGDGSISFEEFWGYMRRRGAKVDPSKLVNDVFKVLDTDGSGSVTASEFTEMMQKINSGMSVEEIKELVKEIDTGGDGEISLHEFAEVLRKYK